MKGYASFLDQSELFDANLNPKESFALSQISELIKKSYYLTFDFDNLRDKFFNVFRNLEEISNNKYYYSSFKGSLRELELLIDKVLNPTFTNATKLIGMRGDGDLVIDDVLIDIKTVKKIQNLRDYYNQLVGYYTLYKIGGITNMPPSNKIKRLGIYFSRYAYLRIYDVENFDNEDNDFASFVEWFKERALQEI